jgi:ActR/RegA family two-component response regulator
VILTGGTTLQAPVAKLETLGDPLNVSLEDSRRKHIECVLLETKGNLSVAARRLGLKRDNVAIHGPSIGNIHLTRTCP